MNDQAQVEDFDGGEEEVDTNAAIREAFDAAISQEADEDEVKLEMISGGATFKNVTRLYNQFMIDAGLAISKADRNQIVEDTLSGLAFDTEEGFDGAVAAIQAAVQGSTDRSAAALVRAYGKKNELDVYTKPKGEGTPRVSFASQYYDFLAANPTMAEDDAKAYVMGEGDNAETSENVQKNLPHYIGIYRLVNKIATA